MTKTAHDELLSRRSQSKSSQPRRSQQAGTAALLTAAAAMLGAGLYVQRRREELATLGHQNGVPADPQT